LDHVEPAVTEQRWIWPGAAAGVTVVVPPLTFGFRVGGASTTRPSRRQET